MGEGMIRKALSGFYYIDDGQAGLACPDFMKEGNRQ